MLEPLLMSILLVAATVAIHAYRKSPVSAAPGISGDRKEPQTRDELLSGAVPRPGPRQQVQTNGLTARLG